jgi:RNA polymerase sigma-70 factor (ECF subfamily)
MNHPLHDIGDADDSPARLVEPFDVFYRREFPRMVDLAFGLSGRSWAAAEDLAQEAMIAAHRNWSRVAGFDNPATWVRRVVLNRAASRFHRGKAELRALIRLPSLRSDRVEPLDHEAQEFWETVRSLSERQAQAIALRYLDELSTAEIAEVLGCSPSTVKVHLHRGRKELARRLELEES